MFCIVEISIYLRKVVDIAQILDFNQFFIKLRSILVNSLYIKSILIESHVWTMGFFQNKQVIVNYPKYSRFYVWYFWLLFHECFLPKL